MPLLTEMGPSWFGIQTIFPLWQNRFPLQSHRIPPSNGSETICLDAKQTPVPHLSYG